MAKVRNKHGRVGVKKYTPNLPLAVTQKQELRAEAFKTGWKAGEKKTLENALLLVNGAKNIRSARRMLEELVQGLAK